MRPLSSPFLSAKKGLFLFQEREEVGAMDRESDMAEGDMGMFKSSANIQPPLRGKPRRNRQKAGRIRQ
jgi:hypothetical protein